jgi:microcystin-dependent protein
MLISAVFPPVGSIISYAGTGNTVPPGYELTLGQELPISDYPELFSAIGYAYGIGDPGTFRLPNLQDAAHNPCLIYTGFYPTPTP